MICFFKNSAFELVFWISLVLFGQAFSLKQRVYPCCVITSECILCDIPVNSTRFYFHNLHSISFSVASNLFSVYILVIRMELHLHKHLLVVICEQKRLFCYNVCYVLWQNFDGNHIWLKSKTLYCITSTIKMTFPFRL